MTHSAILSIQDLTIVYESNRQQFPAVLDFSMDIAPGQTYGLVGESGSGKTTIALAIMGHLSVNGQVTSGSILFNDQNLLNFSEDEMRNIWGKHINLVPQDPLSSLNPSIKIGDQINEITLQHSNRSRQEVDAYTIDLLKMVKIPDPERVANSYPHQISGGMQQRVLIAMALSTEPQLLVLDEPTTGLDVTTQAAVLDLFADLIKKRGTAALYVTHNLGVVAQVCDRVAVLYAGELVEDGAVSALFGQPFHPYTAGLLRSVPQIGQNKRRIDLQAIPGQIPSIELKPLGCVFAPRCPIALDKCHESRPDLEQSPDGRAIRCFRWHEIAAREITVFDTHQGEEPVSAANFDRETALVVDDLQVYFPVSRSLADMIKGRPKEVVRAVDGINFNLAKGKTVGIVGESGSGKTTLARAIVGLTGRTGGDVKLLGLDLEPLLESRSEETLRMLQYVFQNPEGALNPYMSVGETLKRPFITLLKMNNTEAEAEVARLLTAVRLPADYAQRWPGQLSGGEKQRVAIARAFATLPDLLLTDEPVSALDVSVQASVLNLLRDLQVENNTTMVFISHDLAVVGYLADVIAVMYVGKIMEIAETAALFAPPYHPYTEALLSSIPDIDPDVEREPILLEGDVPSQMELPAGCPFHPRCHRKIGGICETETPPWQIGEDGKRIFCHIPLADLKQKQI